MVSDSKENFVAFKWMYGFCTIAVQMLESFNVSTWVAESRICGALGWRQWALLYVGGLWKLCVGFMVCGSCGVLGLRCVAVAVCGSCVVWGLRLVGIEVFGSCGVWEKQCVGVAMSGGRSV